MRIDLYLQENGYAPTRSRAKTMIEEGMVELNGKIVEKPSLSVEGEVNIRILDTLRYVSRGGLKLEAALSAFSISPRGRVVLDVGASSGGFTDCVLKAGASLVYAIDSGCGQLAASLRDDPRVICREHCNARYMTATDFPIPPTLCVMDVSFISQTLILPAIAAILPTGGELVSLIKPQFEAGRAAIGKGGIVREEKDRIAAVRRVTECAETLGLVHLHTILSPIRGGDGNIEYLAHFQNRKKEGSE